MIEIKNLSKSYGNTLVLYNMNTKIPLGKIYGLVGINGSGKSTLMRLISGASLPDSGKISINDVALDDTYEKRKDIYYLSDNPPHGNFTTFNDLYKLHKVFYNMNKQTFDDILNLYNLDPDVALSKLSKGMRRQGYIALAFATNAKYLLLDEVFDGLDPSARLKFRKYIINYMTEDKLIMISSHSLRELEDICDQFGYIDNGHFKSSGNIDTFLSSIQKYRIILSNPDTTMNFDSKEILYFKQDGRVLILLKTNELDIHSLFEPKDVLAIDQLDLSFEEYFILSQEGGQSK